MSRIYLDNSATSFPKPPSSLKRAAWAMANLCGNPGRSGHALSLAALGGMYEVREAAAQMFGAEAENVIFTYNATHALNMAIKGSVAAGGEVICTNFEHNSVLRPLYALEAAGIINLKILDIDLYDDRKTLRRLKSIITPKTSAVVCTHVSNVCGKIMPVRDIGGLCGDGVTFIVDASQSAGILPINIKSDKIDILCLPSHKGLMGIMGAGILAVGRGARLSTIIEGGSGTSSQSHTMPDEYPERLEAGTPGVTAIYSMLGGMEFISKVTLGAIEQREREFKEIITEGLCDLSDIAVYAKEANSTSLVLFNHKTIPSDDFAARLDEQGICVRAGLHCAPLAHKALSTHTTGAVRVSPGYFNTRAQCDSFLKKVSEICRRAR